MHKWADVIKAWADGEIIQQREYPLHPAGEWGPWTELKDGRAPIRTDMYVEYRVQPKNEPHKWQKEREAFLAGKKVEFQNPTIAPGQWRQVDSWLEGDCRRVGNPIWDREHLKFRIADVHVVKQCRAVLSEGSGSLGLYSISREPMNLKLTFENGKLKEAEVLS